MEIDRVNVYKVNIPLKFTASHSQKDATSVDNIVVEIFASHNGLKGYGEGGPRPYVTSETQDGAIDAVRSLCLNGLFPWSLKDTRQIWDLIDGVTEEKNHNSALCALEIALLDLLARSENQNILYYLPRSHYANEIYYGATVPLPRNDTFFKLCKIIKQLEIKDVRLKMGRDIRQNHGALKLLRSMIGPNCDLRVDPNMGWNLKSAMRHLPLLSMYEVGILEQPLAPGDNGWGGLAGIAKTKGLKLQADESVCSMADLEKVIEEGHFDIVNVRLSKCGGFRNSLRIIQRIRNAGLNYQVGCQLGESGILSAAGRALCSISSDALYYDGSYDRFLLRENLTSVHVNFAFRGKASPLDGPGLGITVNTKSLQKFTDYSITIQRP